METNVTLVDMAAEIKPVERQSSGAVQKPELLSKIEGFTADVNFAAFTPREDGVITVSDDRCTHTHTHTYTHIHSDSSTWLSMGQAVVGDPVPYPTHRGTFLLFVFCCSLRCCF